MHCPGPLSHATTTTLTRDFPTHHIHDNDNLNATTHPLHTAPPPPPPRCTQRRTTTNHYSTTATQRPPKMFQVDAANQRCIRRRTLWCCRLLALLLSGIGIGAAAQGPGNGELENLEFPKSEMIQYGVAHLDRTDPIPPPGLAKHGGENTVQGLQSIRSEIGLRAGRSSSGSGPGEEPTGPDIHTDQDGNDGDAEATPEFSAANSDTTQPADARASSSVVCWGVNRSSDRYRGQTDVPMELQRGGVAEVSIGGRGFNGHTCAMMVDGGARCWGDNSHGQSTVPGSEGEHPLNVERTNILPVFDALHVSGRTCNCTLCLRYRLNPPGTSAPCSSHGPGAVSHGLGAPATGTGA